MKQDWGFAPGPQQGAEPPAPSPIRAPSRIRFRHGAMHELPDGLILANSYHVSRYNTNTGRLTTEMFETVMFALGQKLAAAA